MTHLSEVGNPLLCSRDFTPSMMTLIRSRAWRTFEFCFPTLSKRERSNLALSTSAWISCRLSWQTWSKHRKVCQDNRKGCNLHKQVFDVVRRRQHRDCCHAPGRPGCQQNACDCDSVSDGEWFWVIASEWVTFVTRYSDTTASNRSTMALSSKRGCELRTFTLQSHQYMCDTGKVVAFC